MSDNWDHLKEIVSEVLKKSKQLGLDAAEASVSWSSGLSATVRLGTVESVEFNRDKGLGITVYKGKKKGSVSTTDLQPAAIQSSLEAACRIAEYTEEDPYSGLADIESLARDIPNLDLDHPSNVTAEQAVQWAKECEDSARAFDSKIANSEGATFATHRGYRVYGNTLGFLGAYPGTRHSLNCIVIAKSGDCMQRDYDFTTARDIKDLNSRNSVGQTAALRSIRRLNARKMKTCEAPVIFSAEIAGGLWGSFIAAISGGNLYRRSSFLVDHLDKRIFPDFVNVEEIPHLRKGLGSAPFDDEGVATVQHSIVQAGILKSYVLSSYSARRLGLKTTGNAGGVNNLFISDSECDLADLIKRMGRGLLVTELMGHGVNLVTGDYSRGAGGFWIEDGQIQYPVHEITVAANLKDMFSNLVAIGDDTEKRGNIFTGSVLIDRMMIAGS